MDFVLRLGLLFLIPLISVGQQPISTKAQQLHEQVSKAYSSYLTSPDSAIQQSQDCLISALETKNILEEGRTYLVLSKAYWAKGNFLLSTEFGFKALKILENSSNQHDLVLTQLALGRTLTDISNPNKAQEFIRKAIALASTLDDTLLLGEAIREYSFLLVTQNKLDSAIYYADKGIAIFKEKNALTDLSILYGRKARIYFERKDFATSRDYAYKGLELDSIVGNNRGLAISQLVAAQTEYEFGNSTKAISLATRSIELSRTTHNLSWLIRGYHFMATLYQKKGDYKNAHLNSMLSSQYKDSLFSVEKSAQAEEMEALYELDNKQKTIQLLENENKLKQQQFTTQKLYGALLISAIALLLVIIFFLIRLRISQEKSNQKLAQQKAEIQKQAENLNELNELKTKLFSIISHDLRGPINNLHALLNMLTSNIMTPQEFMNLSGSIKHNIESTQRNLENLLNWSLAQMGGLKTEGKAVRISDAVEDSTGLLTHIADVKKINFQKTIHEDAVIHVDPNQFQLILRNIIQNAIKFSKEESSIQLHTQETTEHWKITITDSGIGMTADEINNVLNESRFFSKVGTQLEKGTGLGIMLCKEFIRLNNGTLELTSSINTGTSVTVVFPKA
jgi:two-component system sensor histidine kinase/response regulator